jgi:drug/metabolite transporter (DMT)-like permease
MSRRGWVLFIALSIIWGLPYLFIRIAVRELSPGTLVFFRTAPAGLLLLPAAIRAGWLAPVLRRWRAVVTYTAIEIAIPWLLLSRAEQRLPSSLTGLLIAAVPLIAAVLYRATGDEPHLGRSRLLGLFVGFAGAVVLVGVDVRGANVLALAEVAVVALCYATGPLLASRLRTDVPSMAVITASFWLTAMFYAPYALTHLPTRVSFEVGASVAVLALVCTTLAFAAFFALIAEVGPGRSTVITYVNPAVAVLLGVIVLGEPLTAGIGIGFPLILVGSFLATRRSIPPSR